MDFKNYSNYSLPLVRRTFPSLFGVSVLEQKGFIRFHSLDESVPVKELLTIGKFVETNSFNVKGVQPLTAPIGLAYAMRYVYDGGNINDIQ